jgi:transcriptional regulator with XRE-family HTH domain
MVHGLSQQELGEKVGVSFQQMQKYEKGVNRVSAGRLSDLAAALGVPITTFYDTPETPTGNHGAALRLISASDAFQLVQYFARLKNRSVRRSLVNVVKLLADKV